MFCECCNRNFAHQSIGEMARMNQKEKVQKQQQDRARFKEEIYRAYSIIAMKLLRAARNIEPTHINIDVLEGEIRDISFYSVSIIALGQLLLVANDPAQGELILKIMEKIDD
jgi:hypothetical protein